MVWSPLLVLLCLQVSANSTSPPRADVMDTWGVESPPLAAPEDDGFHPAVSQPGHFQPPDGPQSGLTGPAGLQPLVLGGSECTCWNGTSDPEDVECRCRGEALTELPANLSALTARL